MGLPHAAEAQQNLGENSFSSHVFSAQSGHAGLPGRRLAFEQ
jgi:hypothetical protein